MSVDELRTRFADLAGSVVPDEDPYGQLMRRARRRRTRWAGGFAALAALLATLLTGQTVLGLGSGGPERRPDQRRTDPADGFPVDSEWTWKLINAPARGKLARDEALVNDLARAFDRHRAKLGVSAALPKVRILFAEDLTNRRVVVAVYHSGSAATLVSRTGGNGASAEDLFASGVSTGPQRVEPFTVVQRSTERAKATRTAVWATPWLLGLAPPGCQIRSGLGQYGPDGTVSRTSEPAPTGDYLLLTPDAYRGTWEVHCAGVRRYQGPVGHRVDEIANPAMTVAPATAAQGVTDGDSLLAARQAGSAYGPLLSGAGLRGVDPAQQQPTIRWSGLVPGPSGLTPAALLVPPTMAGPFCSSQSQNGTSSISP